MLERAQRTQLDESMKMKQTKSNQRRKKTVEQEIKKIMKDQQNNQICWKG